MNNFAYINNMVEQATIEARVGKVLKVGNSKMLFLGKLDLGYSPYSYISDTLSLSRNQPDTDEKNALESLGIKGNRPVCRETILGDLC